MEFNEKLQNLRKQKGLTQEELAEAIFVSRTAVSKWESGRGYPNIDSLKQIATFFQITIDELLSSEEVLTLAEQDIKHKGGILRDLVFGLLDLSVALFLFLPLFKQIFESTIYEVSLIQLTEIAIWLKTTFFIFVIFTFCFGTLTLSLQNCKLNLWNKSKVKISLLLNILGVLLFIMSSQIYAAALLFIFLVIKVLVLIKSL